jgi:ParB-like chromosome segregation protein Spo0J
VAVKRFGGGGGTPNTGGGKLASIAAAVQGDLNEASRQLERPIDRSRGVFERTAVENVRPDPQNPRNLHLTWEELTQGIQRLTQREDGAPRDEREKTLEYIRGLSVSFKNIGQLQAINVYRDDRGMLRIMDGECRYWAARLAEFKEIEAKVRPDRPKYLRLEQYAANSLRADLSLSSQLINLEMVLVEADELGTPVKSLNEFSTVLGKPRATVQLWWSILRSNHEDVKSAMRAGTVTSLETAYAAAQEVDPGRRAALLEGQALPARGSSQRSTQRASGRGRPKTAVELGRAKDLEIVRKLIEAIPVDQDFDKTDWSDPTAVQNAWRLFIEAFTRNVKKQAQPVQG